MAGIRDIAREAGVSVSSVSRALNGHAEVSDETRARIRQIAERLHYYPRASARHLVTNRGYTIGVVFDPHDGSGFRHPFIAHVLTVFQKELARHSYDVLMFGDPYEPFSRWGFMERIRHREVDGVLLIGVPDGSVQQLLESKFPAVTLDFQLEGTGMPSVTSDNRSAMERLVLLLKANGYRRMTYITGPTHFQPAKQRTQGFLDGVRLADMAPDDFRLVSGDFTFEAGRAGAQEILSGPLPDVVLCCADIAALGVLNVFGQAGIHIPDAVAVVGFDDIEAARHVYPSLTTVSQDKQAIGVAAVRLLLSQINHEPVGEPHVVVPTSLVSRATTKPLEGVEHFGRGESLGRGLEPHP